MSTTRFFALDVRSIWILKKGKETGPLLSTTTRPSFDAPVTSIQSQKKKGKINQQKKKRNVSNQVGTAIR